MKKSLIIIITVFTVVVLAKMSFDPVLVFQNEINFGGTRDYIFTVMADNNGYIVSGTKRLRVDGDWKKYSKAIKFDANSDFVWEYTGTEGTQSTWQSLALAPDGIFLGEGWDTASVSKIDNSGNLVWKKNFGTEACPILVSDENYLIVFLSTHSTCTVVICDLHGNQIDSWDITMDLAYAVILQGTDLYILGDNPGGVLTNVHTEIVKTDLSGNIAWSDTLIDAHGPRGTIDANGDLYVSATYIPNAQSWFKTVKYDLAGNRIWERLYDGDLVASYNQGNHLNSVISHPNKGVVVTGDLTKIGGNDPNSLDGGAIAYDSDGDVYFKIRYDANPGWYRTTFHASLFCPDGCLALFGATIENLNPGTPSISFISKWDDVSPVEPEPYAVPEKFSLYQNYPNPFNPTTTINYKISITSPVILRVYDVLGKEIATLVDEEKPAGTYSVDFNATNLPSGNYFYRLTTDNFSQAKKMVLIR